MSHGMPDFNSFHVLQIHLDNVKIKHLLTLFQQRFLNFLTIWSLCSNVLKCCKCGHGNSVLILESQ